MILDDDNGIFMRLRAKQPKRHAPTPEERAASLIVNAAEREALAAMRDLADFDVLCKLSEKLIKADRRLAKAHRQARRGPR